MRRDVSMTIRISQPMKEALQRLSDGERRSFSQLVVLVLEKYLEARHEWPPKTIRGQKARSAARRR
jgi:predicted transcriptional regulator